MTSTIGDPITIDKNSLGKAIESFRELTERTHPRITQIHFHDEEDLEKTKKAITKTYPLAIKESKPTGINSIYGLVLLTSSATPKGKTDFIDENGKLVHRTKLFK